MNAWTSGEVLPNAARTSSTEPKWREPSVFETCENPNRWVTVAWFSPERPRLVVITTTPFDALEPYSAAAEAPFRTSRVSMSLGLRSARRLTGLSWFDALPPAAAAVIALAPDGTATFDTMTPSTTYSGDDWPLMVETPRRRSWAPPPGAPELYWRLAPEILPCIAVSRVGAETRLRSASLMTDAPLARLLLTMTGARPS